MVQIDQYIHWQRRFLSMAGQAQHHLKKEALVGGLSNAVFNGLIAWWLLAGGSALGWTGKT
jgi:hypothetical protein